MSSENRRAALIAAAATNQANGLAAGWGVRRGKVLSIARELSLTLDLLDTAERKGQDITWENANAMAQAVMRRPDPGRVRLRDLEDVQDESA